MTNSVVSAATAPAHSQDRRARWRVLYEAMARLNAGDLISYEEMGNLLGLNFLDHDHKQAISVSARKAADELQRQEKKVLRIVRGHGYQVAQPGQVIELAHRHQARAVAEVDAGHAAIDTIDLSGLDATTARLVEATAMGFARQAVIMRQFDVRQQRLETAMAALTETTQTAVTRVDEASKRVDANEAEIQQLQRRLAELEANKVSGSHR
ncbi:hypothetical protein [Plantactinospora sp. CA-290183]|uniref:hypothetical protein n=1 Tax=Plantactinospora sp. CA-290183 TaxID=3240006 RepID=UPI003D8E4916